MIDPQRGAELRKTPDYRSGYSFGREHPYARVTPPIGVDQLVWSFGVEEGQRARHEEDAQAKIEAEELRELEDYGYGYRAGLELPVDAIIDPNPDVVTNFEAWELGIAEGRAKRKSRS